MHEAEKTLTTLDLRVDYYRNLFTVIGVEHLTTWGTKHPMDFYRILRASAPQRAEAFLKTLNLWLKTAIEGLQAIALGDFPDNEEATMLKEIAHETIAEMAGYNELPTNIIKFPLGYTNKVLKPPQMNAPKYMSPKKSFAHCLESLMMEYRRLLRENAELKKKPAPPLTTQWGEIQYTHSIGGYCSTLLGGGSYYFKTKGKEGAKRGRS